jgi:zinc protease
MSPAIERGGDSSQGAVVVRKADPGLARRLCPSRAPAPIHELFEVSFMKVLSFAMVVIVSTVALAAPATAQQSPTPIAEIEGISHYQLDNGLNVLLFPDPSSSTVTVNLTILVGSRHEGYGETGMAHLLEHMLFKGTPEHQDIPKLLKDRGATFNGSTWLDRTNYYETLNATDENLEFAIRMEADRLINSLIRPEDLASEMTVVRNEFEMGENSPQRVLMQRIMATAYEWHNYGKSTIGNRSDIERVPVPNLRAFYEKYYQPDNAVLIVAGKFQPAAALDLVVKYFGAIPRPERKLDLTWTDEPAQDGERVVTLRRVGDVSLVGVAYHVPAAAHEDYPAIQVLSEILSREPGGRLYEALIKSQMATDVSCMDMGGHDPGVLLAMAEIPTGGDVDAVRAKLLETIEAVGTEGVTEDDVRRAVTAILKQRENLFANTTRLAVNLSEWCAYGDWRLFFLHRDRVEKVTPEQVVMVAQKYLQRNNRTVGVFLPTEKAERIAIPERPNVSQLVAEYKGREKIAEGEAFDPSPEAIEQRTTRGRLTSGVQYALLPKKTRGETVVVTMTLHYGNAENLAGRNAACELLPEVMLRGTEGMTYQQLQDRIDELRATLNANGSEGNLNVSLQARRAYLADTLRLVRDVLRTPALAADEFEIVRKESITAVEQQKREPQTLAINALNRQLSQYPADDVRYVPTIEESIARYQSLTIDDVRTLYKEFLGGEHGEIAIVGDFDPEEVLPILEETFADWQAARPYERIPEPAQSHGAVEPIVIETPDKENAVFIAGLQQPIRDDDPMYEAILLGNYILGGGPLSSRLADRVRKKEGLSYTVNSAVMGDSFDERTAFLVFAIANPANRDRLVATVQEEIQLMLDSGVTGEELAAARDSYLEMRARTRSEDRQLANQLKNQLETGRTMEFELGRESRVRLLDKKTVDESLRRLIDPGKLTVVTAGDFARAAKAPPPAGGAGGDAPNGGK